MATTEGDQEKALDKTAAVKQMETLLKTRSRAERRLKRVLNQLTYETEKVGGTTYTDLAKVKASVFKPLIEDARALQKSINDTQSEVRALCEKLDDEDKLDEADAFEEDFDKQCRVISVAVDLMDMREDWEKNGRGSVHGPLQQSFTVEPDRQYQMKDYSTTDDAASHGEETVQRRSTPALDHEESEAEHQKDDEATRNAAAPSHQHAADDDLVRIAAQAAVAAMQATPGAAAGPSVRLPQLQLTEFDGDITKWPEFWQTFESAVHSQPNLPAISKFTYLKGVLRGPAAASLQGLPITAANYPIALDMLKERFGKTSIIVATLYRRFADVPTCSNRFQEIKSTIDAIERILRQLTALGENLDVQSLLVQQTMAKLPLPLVTRLEEQRADRSQPWIMSSLRAALTRYVDLQTTVRKMADPHLGPPRHQSHPQQQRQQPHPDTLSSLGAQNLQRPPPKCVFCKGAHYNDECTTLKTVMARKQSLSEQRRCFRCLGQGHMARECSRNPRTCPHCQKRDHNRALCPKKDQKQPGRAQGTSQAAAATVVSSEPTTDDSPPTTAASSITLSLASGLAQSALLQTARCQLRDVNDEPVMATALLDSGSQRSFITENLARKLQLPTKHQEVLHLSTMASTKPRTFDSKVMTVELLLQEHGSQELCVNSLPTITKPVTKQPVPERDMDFLKKLPPDSLADTIPTSADSVAVDLLIGADYFWQLVQPDRLTLPSGLHLVSSKLGYLLTGRQLSDGPSTAMLAATSALSQATASTAIGWDNSSMDPTPNLWQLDGIGIRDSPFQDDDETALTQFRQATVIDNGRYAIRWPWKAGITNDRLPTNYGLALGRMKSLSKRLANDTSLLTDYDKVLQQQLAKGIIERVPAATTSNLIHYLPHHPVVTPAKSTKVRIVYDASAKSSKHALSLNDCLYRGPVLLPDLCGMLLRFRMKPIVISADVEKAFLQIGIQPNDRDVTRFLWYDNLSTPQKVDGNLITYRFCRVPFGIVSSPFLLAATIQLHLSKASTPIAQDVAKNLYVDNLITTVYTTDEGINLYREAKQLFNEASLNLRDWLSNSPEVMQQIPDADRLKGKPPTVLGLKWCPTSDVLRNDTSSCPTAVVTKRRVLNEVASVFDPLGLLTPLVLHGKKFLRTLWEEQLEWDAPVEPPLQEDWQKVSEALQQTASITIPRWIGPASEHQQMQLHIFTDASKDAYAAAAYLRVDQPQSSTASVNLLYARSRLAPAKVSPTTGKSTMTIPRMELLGVLIGSRMASFIQAQLHVRDLPVYLWTDARCVLQWLTSTHHLTTFVANRIKELKTNERLQYRHVRSPDNPADLATRGLSPSELQASSLWWQGPAWLAGEEETWPKQVETVAQDDIAEAEKEVRSPVITIANAATEPDSPFETATKQSSSLTSLLRKTALCLRFIGKRIWQRLSTSTQDKLRPKIPLLAQVFDESQTGPPTAMEIERAERFHVRLQQHRYFADTIQAIQQRNKAPLQRQLGVQFDANGLLRCHGRLDNASLPETAIRPLLLPRGSHLTDLIIQDVHSRFIHAGVPHTLSQVRRKFWVIQGRAAVKSVISKCSWCRRHEGQPFRLPQMPPLPAERVKQSYPFQFVGLDYMGPFHVANNGTSPKVWVCLFTCMATRAVHLEVVPGLSTPLFVNVLKRFIARRGRPDRIISDNAPQFHLAKTYLDNIWQAILTSPELAIFLSNKRITWTFTTEFAPWQGGFYERLVGLVKRSFRKCIGRSRLTLEQFSTIVTEVEATVNTRPLVYVPSDKVTDVITPNHFLAPARQLMIPDTANLSDDATFTAQRNPAASILEGQRKQQAALNNFWTSWREEYLLSLRENHTAIHRKNQGQTRDPKIGEVVIVKNDNLPRTMWKLGRILEVLTSREDDQIRTARVATENSILQRPISHLYPLEVSAPLDGMRQVQEEDNKERERPQPRSAATRAKERLEDIMNEENMPISFNFVAVK